LTQVDFLIDSQSRLLSSILFNVHSDTNAGEDIPVEIDFSDFRSVSGAQIPFHIQKVLNGSVFLDIQIQNVTVNSGLTASAFAVQ
jgi:hypothetical protein